MVSLRDCRLDTFWRAYLTPSRHGTDLAHRDALFDPMQQGKRDIFAAEFDGVLYDLTRADCAKADTF